MSRYLFVFVLFSAQIQAKSCWGRLTEACLSLVCGAARYEDVRIIGEGGFAKVYLRKRLSDGTLVAHKAIKMSYIRPWTNDIANNSFETEATLYGILNPDNNSPFIPKFYGVKTDNFGKKVLELEYIDGPDLDHYKDKRKKLVALEFYESLDELATFTRDLTVRLEAIHKKGVLHTDLKLDNVIRKSSDGSLYIFDFGVSSLRRNSSDSYSHPQGGGNDNRAPEINYKITNPDDKDAPPIGPASDFYSLGYLLKELHDDWFDPKNLKIEFSNETSVKNEQIRSLEARKRLAAKFKAEIINPLLRNNPHERPSPQELIYRVNQFRTELEEQRLNE